MKVAVIGFGYIGSVICGVLCKEGFEVLAIEKDKKLVNYFPKQVIGVKDSSYNLFEKLEIENFSILPGSETKLLKGAIDFSIDGPV